MTADSFQRPIGFSPSEISALVNEEIVSQHAEEAAFLWTMRHRAVSEPHYSLENLAALDERVEAHLDGLRVSGDIGWRCCKANLEHLGPSEVFALSVMAFGGTDRERMTEALHAGCASPQTISGLVSGLGWLDFGTVSPWIDRLLDAKLPIHRLVGVRASAIHRHDPGSVLLSAVSTPDPQLRAGALRAVGELKRHDLSEQIRPLLQDDDEACRFWAAWALGLNGERAGVTALTRWFERSDSFGLRALQVGLRAMDIEEGRRWVSASAKTPGLGRQAVIAAGILGDPTSIPWLIRKMESQDLARLAAEAFSMVSGVDLAYHDLDQDPPAPAATDDEDIDSVLDLDYESNLPWPSPVSIDKWWQQNQSAFIAGSRYLAGKPITRQSILDVLVSGKQRQRAAAAIELALLEPESALFEVRAVGSSQRQDLFTWTL